MKPATIRVGIGGWTFPPWRGTFYPDKWPIKRELDYASRHVTAIEVNGTFYSAFKPQTFANWRASTPDGFVFALKASRYCVTRKVLSEAGESVARFCAQGIVELGDKLGPILWQLADAKRFDPDDIAGFLALLPAVQDGVALRHVIQAGHASFADPAFVALCRAAGVTIAYSDSRTRVGMADVTGDLIYARLENASEDEAMGYAPEALDRWTQIAHDWARGDTPGALTCVSDERAGRTPRDTFVFLINGAKVRAPAAAMALMQRLGIGPLR